MMVVAVLSIRSLSSAHDSLAGFVQGINARALLAEGVRMAVDRRAIAARNLVVVTNPVDTEIERVAVLAAHQDVLARLQKLDTMVSDPGVSDRAREMVREIERVEAFYGPVALKIVDLALKGRKDEAAAVITTECRPLLVQLTNAAEAYRDYTAGRATELVEEASTAYRRQRMALITACLLAIVSAAVAGMLISRSLLRSLGAEPDVLSRAARQVAAGDLTPLKGAKTAFAGSVMASLTAMQASLAEIVRDVRDSSDSISIGATQIATGNADLSQRTEEQASALQQTSATMDELGSTVHNNAQHAVQANTMAANASAIAVRGGQVVGEVVETMTGISDSSNKISDIIGTVESIAFQTNILALNAAVEAARAGEQGRGFAVVASEVRNLARRSAEAAKEIKTLIGNSLSQVRQGTLLVSQAGTTMQEIVTAIGRVRDIVGEISSASAEQSSGVALITDAVTQIDHVTQQNAALVEESAAAAASLQQQAKQLVEVMRNFRLDDVNGNVAGPRSADGVMTGSWGLRKSY